MSPMYESGGYIPEQWDKIQLLDPERQTIQGHTRSKRPAISWYNSAV